MCLHTAYLLFPLIRLFLCSHNLEYDSSEEKNPRLILYNEKDEIVKVSFQTSFTRLHCDTAHPGSARMSGPIHVGKFIRPPHRM